VTLASCSASVVERDITGSSSSQTAVSLVLIDRDTSSASRVELAGYVDLAEREPRTI
jgi:hypothetical protein